MTLNLNTENKRQAITLYLSLLHRFHKLSERELEVTVELLLAYFEYLEMYKSEAAAFKLYTEPASRKEIIAKLNITNQVFRNYLTTLKKKNVLQDGMRINKVLIPTLDGGKYVLNIKVAYAEE